jgi:hypothetical protein
MRRSGFRRVSLLRLFGAGVVCTVAVAYVQPIRAYIDARDEVTKRQAEKSVVVRRQAVLRDLLAETGTQAFVEREARRLGLVRPGERLFVVRGVEGWDRGPAG